MPNEKNREMVAKMVVDVMISNWDRYVSQKKTVEGMVKAALQAIRSKQKRDKKRAKVRRLAAVAVPVFVIMIEQWWPKWLPTAWLWLQSLCIS